VEITADTIGIEASRGPPQVDKIGNEDGEDCVQGLDAHES
jgi:hypothetical protein